MKPQKKHGPVGFSPLKTPRFQPDYNDEVSCEQLDAMRLVIETQKPATFSLSPICEPGW